jgi:hypothetical protein
MTAAQLIALWPQAQAAFTAVGVNISLSQALAVFPALADLAAGGATPTPAPAASIPTTLTFGADANLAPYGVGLIGFSPQDHQGADLRNPTNAKYIAYAYLVANKILPSSTWAPAAVAVLSSVVPGVPWAAGDGETLVYGDEYIHVAPRGWGYPDITNRPDLNAQEFFWGSLSA